MSIEISKSGVMTSSQTGEAALLPAKSKGLVDTAFLYEAPNHLKDGKISIREMSICDELNPDVALIRAETSTPVQVMTGDNQITEILLRTMHNAPVGIVLMSPEGEVSYEIYDPLSDGGPQGFIISKGWLMQMIVGEGSALDFLDYWEPRGFCSPGIEPRSDKMYGQEVLLELDEAAVPPEFAAVRDNLAHVINDLTTERMTYQPAGRSFAEEEDKED